MASITDKTITVTYQGRALKLSVSFREGSDVWLVALHGIQSNKAVFDDLFRQPFAQGYSNLAVGLVGFGESDKPDDFSYDVKDQSDVVELALKQLGVRECHIIGHSLGGMVGTLLLPRLGNRILSFANLEGNLVYADCGASKDVVEETQEQFEADGYERLQAKIRESGEKSAAARLKWLETTPARVFYRTSESIVNWSKGEKLKGIFNDATTRRLFMYGDKNSFKADVVAGGVEKVEIPGAGHFMLIDNPTVSYEALARFVSKSVQA